MKFSLAVTGAAILVAGCATMAAGVGDAEVKQTLVSSFKERGVAKMDRLEQTEMQRLCSAYVTTEMPKDVAHKIEKEALVRVRYPADGKYIGDWKAGEKVAQTGVGMQWNDKATTVNGGNCYACHQLSKTEISYGNIGPSLYNYGKQRGSSDPVVKYTWEKIWNSHAYVACSNMPRFGDAGILSEKQLQDVMALLFDPASPVNQ